MLGLDSGIIDHHGQLIFYSHGIVNDRFQFRSAAAAALHVVGGLDAYIFDIVFSTHSEAGSPEPEGDGFLLNRLAFLI